VEEIMWDALFWLYLVNATLLTVHEIDSAYWQEWKLFRLPGGASGFLLLHVPMVFVLFYGVVWIVRQSYAGIVLSLILAFCGIFAFSIHMFFIRTGHPEFRAPVSVAILVATLLVSLAQLTVVVSILMGKPLV
jgi:hypothetical protein